MEPDRYQQNHTLYIFGMISLLISLGSLFFLIFIFPHLLLGWHYDVPEFIAYWREWFVENYAVTFNQASQIIALFFITLTLIFGLCAYFASAKIENSIYFDEAKMAALKGVNRMKALKAPRYFFWKVLGFVILAYVATVVFQWSLYVPPSDRFPY